MVLVGATSEMNCSGDYNGKTTMVKLYEKGWKYLGNISGTSKFVCTSCGHTANADVIPFIFKNMDYEKAPSLLAS